LNPEKKAGAFGASPARLAVGAEAGAGAGRDMPAVLLPLFFGSGCAALIYEIVWFQLLQLSLGSSAVSLAVLLGTFMGGMCAGSLALARVVSLRRHPLLVYAALEFGIGIFGILALFLVPLAERLYAPVAGYGAAGAIARGAVCAVCLLPPTLLMGATLPALARWAETSPQGVSWIGFFQGGNICGAALGCLLAGFYLLRVYDMPTATGVAASINFAVALGAVALAKKWPVSPAATPDRMIEAVKPPNPRPVYLAIGLSGLCALGAETVWTRLMSLMMGPTVYAFSIILAVFLFGLGMGGAAGAAAARSATNPRAALGWCQMLLAAAIAWTAWTVAVSLPYWPVNPLLSRNLWFNFQLDIARALWAMLPASCLWGASFPLALASVASPGQDPGRIVGRVYAANTIGAIVGAVACSLVLIPWGGTQSAQGILVGLSAFAGLIVLVSPRGSPAAFGGFVLPLAGAAVAMWFAWTLPETPWQLIAHGRFLPNTPDVGKLLYMGEGINASVAVTESAKGERKFHVSGKVEASSMPEDMRVQRMLGHLPALLHPHPRSALVVGCGAGVTTGALLTHPTIERIVICEIEPLIPKNIAPRFGKENFYAMDNRRVTIVYDDARHYMVASREKFDIITSDPIHPWVKGAATLYTEEYFGLVKERLNPGGIATQWVPLYESNVAAVKSEIATFMKVFPGGSIWANNKNGAGYDTVAIGPVDDMKVDVDGLMLRLRSERFALESLREVGFSTPISLLDTFAAQGRDLAPWLADAEINLDRNLRLQYLAGLGSTLDQADAIAGQIVAYRKYPDNLFVAKEVTGRLLRRLIEAGRGKK
jgi:spermidine synthase